MHDRPGHGLEGDVMEADLISVGGPIALALRLADADDAPWPPQVPDRLAALALHLADAVPAKRAEEVAVEGKAALDRGDDDVYVMNTGRAHGNLSLSARFCHLLSASVADGPPNGTRVEPALEQLLAKLALRREPQEEPGERAHGDERALDHHHPSRDPLVGRRREPPRPVRLLVEAVEGRARPDEDVPEHRRGDADGGDVAHLRGRAEPLRPRKELDDGGPHDRARSEEARVLERVHRLVAKRGFPERRQVPGEEIHRPERKGDERMEIGRAS